MKRALASGNRNIVLAIASALIMAHGTYLLLAQSRISSKREKQPANGSYANVDHQGQVEIVIAVKDITVKVTEQTEKQVRVLLQNDSQKTMTAVCIEYGNQLTRMDWLGTESTIAPGSTFEHSTSISNPGYALVISAVVFDDNSSQGNPEHLRQIHDYRRGQQTQIARIRNIFKDF